VRLGPTIGVEAVLAIVDFHYSFSSKETDHDEGTGCWRGI
jgi:hypothetical protein